MHAFAELSTGFGATGPPGTGGRIACWHARPPGGRQPLPEAQMGPYLVWLLLAVLAGVVGYVLGRSTARTAELDAETVERIRHEISGLRALVASLKDTAWDHRELDPNLSTIIIDEIRTYERRELEQ